MKTLAYRKQNASLQKFVTDKEVLSDTLERIVSAMFQRYSKNTDETKYYQIVWNELSYMVSFDGESDKLSVTIVKCSAYLEPTHLVTFKPYDYINFETAITTADMYFIMLVYEMYAKNVYQA